MLPDREIHIVDSNGAVLVENRPSLEVRVNQTQLGSKSQAAVVVGRDGTVDAPHIRRWLEVFITRFDVAHG